MMPAPPKPWERAGAASSSRASPLGGSSAEDGRVKPWETSTTAVAGDSVARDAHVAQGASRPWDRPSGVHNQALGPSQQSSLYGQNSQLSTYGGQYGAMPSTSYGAYSGMPSSTYGTGMYGRHGGQYGGGMYGANNMHGASGSYSAYGVGSTLGSGMYGGGYGSGMYGASPGLYGRPGMMGGGSTMYGAGGMYNARQMGPMGMGPPLGPDGLPIGPSTSQTRWQAFMNGISGLMHFFGRLSFLVDENAHALHFFITALLQMLDRASFLYGEIARFVLRLLGYKEPKERAPLSTQSNPERLPGIAAPLASGVDSTFESAWPSNRT